jgi:hypothetical protein
LDHNPLEELILYGVGAQYITETQFLEKFTFFSTVSSIISPFRGSMLSDFGFLAPRRLKLPNGITLNQVFSLRF